MPLAPKSMTDLALAPVAAHIDRNLARVRDCSPQQIGYELQLQLDLPLADRTRDERSDHVLLVALRDVELHGWEAAISADGCRLRLTGGSVSVELGLSANLMQYIEVGATAAAMSL